MYTKKEFNPKLEKKKAYISLFTIIICQLISIIPLLWFDFGVLFTTIFFSLVELGIIINGLDIVYVNHFKYKCDKTTLTHEIHTQKTICRLWIFILVFFCLNNILCFIFSVIFFGNYYEIKRFISEQIYNNQQKSIFLDLLYNFDLDTINTNLLFIVLLLCKYDSMCN